MAGAIAGYLTDHKVAARFDWNIDVMMRDCEEIANAALAIRRQRWPR
jgi:hypothetical protein